MLNAYTYTYTCVWAEIFNFRRKESTHVGWWCIGCCPVLFAPRIMIEQRWEREERHSIRRKIKNKNKKKTKNELREEQMSVPENQWKNYYYTDTPNEEEKKKENHGAVTCTYAHQRKPWKCKCCQHKSIVRYILITLSMLNSNWSTYVWHPCRYCTACAVCVENADALQYGYVRLLHMLLVNELAVVQCFM